MAVHVYKVGNFKHTHERRGFRYLVESLKKKIQDESVYVLGNATIPKVTYHYTNSDKTRTFDGVNPDVIIFKHDAIAVVEMKSYSGNIYFPTNMKEMWKEWICEYENKFLIINEGQASPLSQVDNNRKALIAFLQKYEKDFGDEKSFGSLWYKTSSIILFTEPNTSFAQDIPHFWRNTFVSTIEDNDHRYDLANIIKDLTTPPRRYSMDVRSQITLSDDAIKKLLSLLSAVETKEGTKNAIAEEETHILSTGYGYATIIANTARQIISNKSKDLEIIAPEGIEEEPLPVKLVRYYARCLLEEAKLGTRLNLGRVNYIYPIEQISEPVFFGSGTFEMDVGRIPNVFLQANTQLMYGFFFIVTKEEFAGREYYNGEPFFMTNVRIKAEENRFFCSPINEEELLINRQALQHHRRFADYSYSDLEEYIDEVEQLDEINKKIDKVVSDLGLNNVRDHLLMGKYDVDRIAEGILPVSIVFKSSGGFYMNTIRELERIGDNWKEKIDRDEAINDFAWKFINGISSDDLNQKWQPAPLSIVDSNYEQSQAVGLSLLDDNLLQVVSGPPGTGKSQVIQNIIANASVSGISVLFASRNNKAVNIVVDRLNDRIMELPIILRTGNRDQNEVMFNKLQYIKIDNPDENEAKTFTLTKTKINKINFNLKRINTIYKNFLQALEHIEVIESEFETIRYKHEDLFFITNWYDTLHGDFGFSAWKQLFDEYNREITRGAHFIGRLGFFLKSKMSLEALIYKSEFQIALNRIFNKEVKNKLPKELIDIIGNDDFVKASEDVLPVLSKLIKLNQEYDRIQQILCNVSENELLARWEEIEKSKIEYSRSILQFEWRRKNTGQTVKAAEDLLRSNRAEPAVFNTAQSGFPCCATTSLSIARNAPLNANLFDITVIDEASQSDIASILPILYRGRKSVIIGDEMQLRPVITIEKEFDNKVAKAYGLCASDYETFSYSNVAVLDLAYDRFTRALGKRLLLRNHYRSHPHIIQFSNRWFYQDLLRIRTSSDMSEAIIWQDIKGSPKPRWTNPAEIEAVIGIIKQLLDSGIPHDQIGVVTPFRMQANAIINKLVKKNLFVGDNGSITVSTAHGFQGDERLVMVFSLVIGPEMPKGTILWVHDMKTQSKNLLNVALTRAQQQLYILGNKQLCYDSGGLLRLLVKYVENISTNV